MRYDYFVSKTFTKANSPTATYAEVKSGMTQIGGLVGAGDFDFLSRDGARFGKIIEIII